MIDMSEFKHYNTIEYFITYSELIQAARHRGTITYQELAEAVHFPEWGSQLGRQTGGLLMAVSANELNNGRPLLSALCVSAVDEKPGEGFFWLARHLNVLGEDEDEYEFWLAQKRAVYQTWQKEFERPW